MQRELFGDQSGKKRIAEALHPGVQAFYDGQEFLYRLVKALAMATPRRAAK